MHNAIIYNKENGSVKLDVEIGDKDLSFIVEDTGIGMMKGESAKIFDRFYRIESERTYSVSGIGLGLAVVKMICDRLKIKITVESEPGKGTVMRISGIKYSD
jgi:two-component system phosphate regulon sensor histidine kinase PhoR